MSVQQNRLLFTYLEIFLEALFSSIADAEWSSFKPKQAEHLFLLKMFGANLRQTSTAAMARGRGARCPRGWC